MKKIILMASAMGLALSLIACTGNSDTSSVPKATPKTTPNSSQRENQESSNMRTYMGQVKDKVGNDLTLSIGNFISENDGGDNQIMINDENGNPIIIEGGIENIMEKIPGAQIQAIPMPDDEGGDDSGNTSGGGEMEKLPIEFTGEVRDFTIPAGAKIINTMGKETTLDSIEKGSMVQLVIDESNGVVESVMMW